MINLYGWYEVWVQERPGAHAELVAIVKGIIDARAVQKLYPKRVAMRSWLQHKVGPEHANAEIP